MKNKSKLALISVLIVAMGIIYIASQNLQFQANCVFVDKLLVATFDPNPQYEYQVSCPPSSQYNMCVFAIYRLVGNDYQRDYELLTLNSGNSGTVLLPQRSITQYLYNEHYCCGDCGVTTTTIDGTTTTTIGQDWWGSNMYPAGALIVLGSLVVGLLMYRKWK